MSLQQEISDIIEQKLKPVEDTLVNLENKIDAIELKKGEKGETGDRGEQGMKGKDGIQGKRGIKGEQGEQGIQGINGLNGLDGKNGIDGKESIITKTLVEEIIDKVLSKIPKQKSIYVPTTFGASHSPLHESFAMNGVDTFVTLSAGVEAQGNAIIVRYQGQTLDMTTHYTVNGTKISFTFTPANNTTISITYWS